MKRHALIIAVPFLLLSSGCATKRDVRDVAESLQELHAQQMALIRDVQREQRTLRDTLGLLLRQQQEARGETAMRMARIEDNILLLQELQGVSQQQLSQLREQVERSRTATVPPPQVLSPETPAGASGSADEVFEEGVSRFNRGQLATARVAFEEFLARFPADRRAVDARFRLAEILEEDEPAEALEAFRTIQQYYPTSPRVPESRYRMARLLLQMDDREAAEVELDRILNTWPESEAAVLAQEMLEDLQ